jgi:AGZA family xanthine/uracil permease-like MFS transporter
VTGILIPFTSSITQGSLSGFNSQVALSLVTGRRRELDPMMYTLAAVSVALVWLERGNF